MSGCLAHVRTDLAHNNPDEQLLGDPVLASDLMVANKDETDQNWANFEKRRKRRKL